MKRMIVSKQAALKAIETGEFDRDVIASNRKVVVVMTQDWCYEWTNMKKWMDLMNDIPGLDIYELIYNAVDYFKDFLPLKERTWGNDQIPYLRYYSNGILIHSSNYVGKEDFMKLLEL
ncbi:MAG TPA: hypothetical protein VK435_04420 [Thermodesulfovibrionales bacterium]|nr:hypothetical protein [Thermodesulfovibrionales bacterium]